jgi:hypothetical protein
MRIVNHVPAMICVDFRQAEPALLRRAIRAIIRPLFRAKSFLITAFLSLFVLRVRLSAVGRALGLTRRQGGLCLNSMSLRESIVHLPARTRAAEAVAMWTAARDRGDLSFGMPLASS